MLVSGEDAALIAILAMAVAIQNSLSQLQQQWLSASLGDVLFVPDRNGDEVANDGVPSVVNRTFQ